MSALFYGAATVAVVATAVALTRANVAHALVYLVLSLLASALVFFSLGATVAAALEVVVYAGAIIVLFVFVMVMLGAGDPSAERRMIVGRWAPVGLLGTGGLAAAVASVLDLGAADAAPVAVTAAAVGATLFGPFALTVELASLLLVAALAGARWLGTERP